MVLVRRAHGEPEKPRDEEADYKRSLDEGIARYTDLGLEPTPHLLALRAEIADAEPGLERKDLEPPVENAVPRRPGRPRKPSE